MTVNQTTPNAGLLDQRAAFQWVKQYINLFGGDANNVTILGQFAGGGSVMYHTTWLSGRNSSENSLFKRAIAQSPFSSVVTDPQRRHAFDTLLDAANLSSVDDLRSLPVDSSVLLEANVKVGRTALFNTINFGRLVQSKKYYPSLES